MDTQPIPDIAMRQRVVVTAQTGLFLAVLIAVQMLGLPNFITGTIVNAIFVVSLLLNGLRCSLFLALLSPMGGMFFGHLPAPMYPVLPVIVCGNFVLIGTYHFFSTSENLIRFVLPAALKGLIIGVIGYLVIQKFGMPDQIRWFLLPVLGMQFITALTGLLAGENIYQALMRARGKSA